MAEESALDAAGFPRRVVTGGFSSDFRRCVPCRQSPLEDCLHQRQQAMAGDGVQKEKLMLTLDFGHAAQRGGKFSEAERLCMRSRLYILVNIAVFEPARKVHRQESPRAMTAQADDAPDEPELRFQAFAGTRAEVHKHTANGFAMRPLFAFDLLDSSALRSLFYR